MTPPTSSAQNTPFISTQIRLASRPVGWPTAKDFTTEQVRHGALAPGEVRVVNEFISVDPYMRGRMSAARSYVEPYALGSTITGAAVGRVVESADETLAEGTAVLHQHGWTDTVQAAASTFQAVDEIEGHPLSVYLGILGIPGMTAYVGLNAIGQLQPGETVFVSGAAGAVGSAAGQIARLQGADRVIGAAGTDQKVTTLTERFGYDLALNYAQAPIRQQLVDQLGEGGIDVYFDNVGGDHLEAALEAMNDFGRIVVCGTISSYNATERPAGPDNMSHVLTRRLRMQGFIVAEHSDWMGPFRAQMAQWLHENRISYDETVVEGFDHTLDAFLQMMQGANVGKMVVRC